MLAEKLMEVLEDRFGVPREFATPLIPMLERVASQGPSSDEWTAVLAGVARAYRAAQGENEFDQVSGLMQQFSAELCKLEESMKVLAAYLDRVRQQLHPSLGSHLIH
jgi:hypothetical protein